MTRTWRIASPATTLWVYDPVQAGSKLQHKAISACRPSEVKILMTCVVSLDARLEVMRTERRIE
jgi:hypothetical protein